jgi:hypothetical protein
MHALRWIALLVCIIAGFSRAGAAQQGDPLHDYRLPQFSTDARLRQPVTCTALGTPIANLLQRLSGQTGVSLRASQRTAQWRTVVRVDNLPLAELMASLAAAFDLSWRVLPGKEGQPPAYEIYQTPAQAQRERESFERRVQILERVLPQALAEAQRRVEKGETGADLFPPADRRDDLVQQYASSLVIRPKLRAAAMLLTPQVIRRLVQGEDVYFSGDRLSPQQQNLFTADSPSPSSMSGAVQGQVALVRWQYQPWYSELHVSIRYRAGNGGGGSYGTNLLLPPDPQSSSPRWYDTTDIRTVLRQDELRRTLPEEGTPPKHLTVAQAIHRLSVMVPMNVVAEYYPLSMHFTYPSGAGRNAQEVLQIILSPALYDIRRAGNTLIFAARRRYEHRLCDVPASQIRRWLHSGEWFGLRVQSLREMYQLTPIQRRALGLWASKECDRFGREGDYRAVVYANISDLLYAEGTAVGLWRLLMALPPAAQLRVLSGQPVTVNEFAQGGNLPLIDLSPPFFPFALVDLLPREAVRLQATREVTQHWACDKARFGSIDGLHGLWLSKPGESLTAFRRRLSEQEKVNCERFVQVEVETIRLRLITSRSGRVEPEFTLARFKQAVPASR